MTSEEQLRARLRKIEALFAGATTPGERGAAEAALARIKARLAEARRTAAAVELQFSIADPWSRQLFPMDDGHCGLPLDELVPMAEQLLEIPAAIVEEALSLELEAGDVISDEVDGRSCIFLAGLHRSERAIAGRIQILQQGVRSPSGSRRSRASAPSAPEGSSLGGPIRRSYATS